MSRIATLLDALADALALAGPDRLVTRNWTDFANHQAEDLERGIWTVRWSGMGPLTYETSDNNGITDGMRATQVAPLEFTVLCQQELPANATGEDVDTAELAMLDELDAVAAAVIDIPGAETLQLVTVVPSQQIECPFAWVLSTWKATAL